MKISGQQIELIDLPGTFAKEDFVADWTLYRQALFHLIVNALKFSKPKMKVIKSALIVEVSCVLLKEKDPISKKYNLFLKT